MGIEPTNAWTTIRCVNHFATTAIIILDEIKKIGRGSRNRTHTKGFGDLYSTVELCPYKKLVERGGFEPPNPKERIYSPPRLATSLPLQVNKLKIMVPAKGVEPSTYWLQVSCSTNWATPANIKEIWVRTESNRRHLELQSNALPTELLTHN